MKQTRLLRPSGTGRNAKDEVWVSRSAYFLKKASFHNVISKNGLKYFVLVRDTHNML